MKDFNEIGKKMPYVESEEYLNTLIDNATTNAIAQKKHGVKNRNVSWIITIAAASIIIFAGVGVSFWPSNKTLFQPIKNTHRPICFWPYPPYIIERGPDHEGPVSEFLDNISDFEAQMLYCYEDEYDSPVNEFLDNISDDEANLLDSYEIDEISEY